MILVSEKITKVLIPISGTDACHVITGSPEGLALVQKALSSRQCLEAALIALQVSGREVCRQKARADQAEQQLATLGVVHA